MAKMRAVFLAVSLCCWHCVVSQTLLDVASRLNVKTFVNYVNVTGLAPAFSINGK